ncbi:MAG: N-acetylmuramoyl-L-alanine amidase, partial [Oscillochloris sp.]|nr:N-acetylmuramoyl-L-alanine amidase [Oscillochloris sp.]
MPRLVVLFLLAALIAGCANDAQVIAPTAEPLLPIAEAAEIATPTVSPSSLSAAVLPSPSPTPAGPTSIPTPTPRPVGVAPRVGLQVGHLNASELPEELARFRTSTGARYGDTSEAELNEDIARRVQALLEAEGVAVDLLPATIPPDYDADAFVSIHADGSTSGAARGWKLATPWRASQASRQLAAAVAATYGSATGLPEDVGGVTINMRGYYAFNNRRHDHAIATTTPAILIETGFMTSATDREVLFGQPDRAARGISQGILAYLAQR